MNVLKAGPLKVAASGGSDRNGGGDGPAVLLCHGYGAPGDDLVSLARAVDAGRDVRWFFPEAPLAIDLGYGMTGRAWWPIDMVRLQTMVMRGERASLMQETPDGLFAARRCSRRASTRSRRHTARPPRQASSSAASPRARC